MLTLRRDIVAGSPLVTDIVLSVVGATVIVLATQVAVNLPFTPVPITGQTFGVLVVAMLLGRMRGMYAVGMYLGAGLLGAPVFANFMSLPAIFGPTSGYLLGFLPMAYVAGLLSEKGWNLSYVGAITTGLVAHTVVLICGVVVLSAFVGVGNAWTMGVAPFLVGDIVKSVVAAVVVRLALSKRKT
ncbi:MAG: biotin transporter BioY [bacterium]|nr:biotin transporter BioY [bacterium]